MLSNLQSVLCLLILLFVGHLPDNDQEITYMKACQSGETNPCSYSWTVPVKKCGTFNIMHLKPQGMCGRYCLGKGDHFYWWYRYCLG